MLFNFILFIFVLSLTNAKLVIQVNNQNTSTSDNTNLTGIFTNLNDAFEFIHSNGLIEEEIMITLAPTLVPYNLRNHSIFTTKSFQKLTITSNTSTHNSSSLISNDCSAYARLLIAEQSIIIFKATDVKFIGLKFEIEFSGLHEAIHSSESSLEFTNLCFETHTSQTSLILNSSVSNYSLIQLENSVIMISNVFFKTLLQSRLFQITNTNFQVYNTTVSIEDSFPSLNLLEEQGSLFVTCLNQEGVSSKVNLLEIDDLTLISNTRLLPSYSLIRILNLRRARLSNIKVQNIGLFSDMELQSTSKRSSFVSIKGVEEVVLINTIFENSTVDFESFLEIEDCNSTLIQNNSFISIQTEGSIVKSISNDKIDQIIIADNIFYRLNSAQILDLSIQMIENLQILNNTCQNLSSSDSLINIKINLVDSSNNIAFVDNYFNDITIATLNTSYVYKQINLIYLLIEKQQKELPAGVLFTRNHFSDIYFEKFQPLKKAVFQNSLILFSLGRNELILSNCSFEGIVNKFDDAIIIFSSETVTLENSGFSNLINFAEADLIQIFAKNINILGSKFSNNIAYGRKNGGTIYIDYDAAWISDININIKNCIFQDNIAPEGQAVYVENGLVNFVAWQNLFINNVYSSSSVFHFENTEFVNFLIYGTDFVQERSGASSLVYFESCSFSSPVVFNTLKLKSSALFPLVVVDDSPNINLVISNLLLTFPPNSPDLLTNLASTQHKSFISIEEGNFSLINSLISGFNLNDETLINAKCNENLNIEIVNTTFENGSIVSSQSSTGIIYIYHGDTENYENTPQCQLTIENSTFSGNDLNSSIAAAMINFNSKGSVNISVLNSSFKDNALSISSLFAINNDLKVDLDVEESHFSNNMLKGEGSIFSIPNLDLNMMNSIFEENSFERGNILFTNELIDLDKLKRTNLFQNNIAKGSRDKIIASAPSKLDVNIQFELNPYYTFSDLGIYSEEIKGFLEVHNGSVSSIRYVTLNVSIIDIMGQFFADLNPSKSITFTVDDDQVFTSDNCGELFCLFELSRLRLTGINNTAHVLTIGYENTLYSDFPSKKITFYMRDCMDGEIYVPQTKSCELCPAGSYSLNTKDANCKQCPIGADCVGGSILNIQPGYWREDVHTDQIYQCRTEGNCRGGYESLCLEGRVGALCDSCDLDKGYTKVGSTCGDCSSKVKNLAIMVAIIVATMLYNWYYIHSAWTANTKLLKEQEEQPNKVVLAFYFRIFTTYSQIMVIILTFNLNFPALQFFSIAGDTSSQVFLSSACLMRVFGINNDNLHRYTVIGQVLMPLAKTLFFIIAWSLKWGFKFNKKKASRIILIMVSIFHLDHPGLINALLSYLKCTTLGNGSSKEYLDMDLYVECSSQNYLFVRNLIVFPALSFWGFVVPLLFIYILFRNRKTLKSVNTLRSLGTLYSEYKGSIYFWGFFIMGLKYVLVAISSVVTEVKTKSLLVILTIYIYKVFLTKYKPYQIDELNRMDHHSSLVFLTTVFFVLFYQDNPSFPLRITSLVVIGLVNLVFIVRILLRMLQLHYQKVKEVVQKVGVKIMEKINTIGSTINLEKINNSISLANISPPKKPRKKSPKSQSREIKESYNVLPSSNVFSLVGSSANFGTQKDTGAPPSNNPRETLINQLRNIRRDLSLTSKSNPSSLSNIPINNILTPEVKKKRIIDFSRKGTLDIEIESQNHSQNLPRYDTTNSEDLSSDEKTLSNISTQLKEKESLQQERYQENKSSSHMTSKRSQFKKNLLNLDLPVKNTITPLTSPIQEDGLLDSCVETPDSADSLMITLQNNKNRKLDSSASSSDSSAKKDLKKSPSVLLNNKSLKPSKFMKHDSPLQTKQVMNFLDQLRVGSITLDVEKDVQPGTSSLNQYKNEQKRETNKSKCIITKSADASVHGEIQLSEVNFESNTDR